MVRVALRRGVSASARRPPSPRRLSLSHVSVVLRRSVSASARPPPSPRPFLSMSIFASVMLRRSVSASSRPPPSPRRLSPRLSDVTVVLRRSVSASARPPPTPKPQTWRRSTVTLHHAFKPFNLSRSPRPSGNRPQRLACTTASAFSTAVRIVFEVRRSASVLLAGSILCWIRRQLQLQNALQQLPPAALRRQLLKSVFEL